MPGEVVTTSGPGAAAAAAPAKTVTPAAAAPAAPAGPTPEQVKADLAKLEMSRRDIEKKERQHVVERRKFSAEREAEKKTWGEKLSRLDSLEKAHAQAKMNPEAFLKSVYGDAWYDTVVSAKLNNGVPTADVLASEIAKVEEKLEQKLAAKEAEREKQASEHRAQAAQHARRQLHAEAGQFWEQSGKDFPVVETLGDARQVADILAKRIEATYHRTTQRDEQGNVVRDGQIISLKQAAEALENELISIAEKAVGHEKYREKFKGPLTPAPGSGGNGTPKLQRTENQQRRTLSNDLTGSTPGRTPPATDEERRERALAAINAARSRSSQS